VGLALLPFSLLATALVFTAGSLAAQSGDAVRWRFQLNQGIPAKLVWETRVEANYDLWASSNLLHWRHVEGFPKAGTGLELEYTIETGPHGFFRILAEDGFVPIPAGAYAMGDSIDGLINAPPHNVQISAFEIGRFEVTKALWDTVRAWGETNGYVGITAAWGKAPDHPAQHVLWYAVVKWCNARSEMEGRTPCYYTSSGVVYRSGSINAVTCNWAADGYRLPTEAEWEKAARGGTNGRRFYWGPDISHSHANYNSAGIYLFDISTTSGYHPAFQDAAAPFTAPVGRFAPNAFGLYDMAGNVFEWCWDWWDSDYYASSPGTDPSGPESGSSRILRGGAWSENAGYCRLAYRFWETPGALRSDIGFRLVRRAVQ